MISAADKHKQLNTSDLDGDSGRKCSGACNKFQTWVHFDKKPNGRYGYDSRCKACVKKAKKSYKAKLKKKYDEASNFQSVIVGTAEQEKIDSFAKIIATSIMALIEEGEIE